MAFNFKDLKILLVEDTPAMRDILKSVLQALDVGTVITKESGESAFEEFCDNHFDIIITDWKMADLDGIGLTKKIRKSKQSPNRKIPIILTSGYHNKDWIHLARDAGVTELLLKPFAASDLAKRIAYVLNKPRPFIEKNDYIGPDRRRRNDPAYKGPERRDEKK